VGLNSIHSGHHEYIFCILFFKIVKARLAVAGGRGLSTFFGSRRGGRGQFYWLAAGGWGCSVLVFFLDFFLGLALYTLVHVCFCSVLQWWTKIVAEAVLALILGRDINKEDQKEEWGIQNFKSLLCGPERETKEFGSWTQTKDRLGVRPKCHWRYAGRQVIDWVVYATIDHGIDKHTQ
jgi:hypothetical protein